MRTEFKAKMKLFFEELSKEILETESLEPLDIVDELCHDLRLLEDMNDEDMPSYVEKLVRAIQ